MDPSLSPTPAGNHRQASDFRGTLALNRSSLDYNHSIMRTISIGPRLIDFQSLIEPNLPSQELPDLAPSARGSFEPPSPDESNPFQDPPSPNGSGFSLGHSFQSRSDSVSYFSNDLQDPNNRFAGFQNDNSSQGFRDAFSQDPQDNFFEDLQDNIFQDPRDDYPPEPRDNYSVDVREDYSDDSDHDFSQSLGDLSEDHDDYLFLDRSYNIFQTHDKNFSENNGDKPCGEHRNRFPNGPFHGLFQNADNDDLTQACDDNLPQNDDNDQNRDAKQHQDARIYEDYKAYCVSETSDNSSTDLEYDHIYSPDNDVDISQHTLDYNASDKSSSLSLDSDFIADLQLQREQIKANREVLQLSLIKPTIKPTPETIATEFTNETKIQNNLNESRTTIPDAAESMTAIRIKNGLGKQPITATSQDAVLSAAALPNNLGINLILKINADGVENLTGFQNKLDEESTSEIGSAETATAANVQNQAERPVLLPQFWSHQPHKSSDPDLEEGLPNDIGQIPLYRPDATFHPVYTERAPAMEHIPEDLSFEEGFPFSNILPKKGQIGIHPAFRTAGQKPIPKEPIRSKSPGESRCSASVVKIMSQMAEKTSNGAIWELPRTYKLPVVDNTKSARDKLQGFKWGKDNQYNLDFHMTDNKSVCSEAITLCSQSPEVMDFTMPTRRSRSRQYSQDSTLGRLSPEIRDLLMSRRSSLSSQATQILTTGRLSLDLTDTLAPRRPPRSSLKSKASSMSRASSINGGNEAEEFNRSEKSKFDNFSGIDFTTSYKCFRRSSFGKLIASSSASSDCSISDEESGQWKTDLVENYGHGPRLQSHEDHQEHIQNLYKEVELEGAERILAVWQDVYTEISRNNPDGEALDDEEINMQEMTGSWRQGHGKKVSWVTGLSHDKVEAAKRRNTLGTEPGLNQKRGSQNSMLFQHDSMVEEKARRRTFGAEPEPNWKRDGQRYGLFRNDLNNERPWLVKRDSKDESTGLIGRDSKNKIPGRFRRNSMNRVSGLFKRSSKSEINKTKEELEMDKRVDDWLRGV